MCRKTDTSMPPFLTTMKLTGQQYQQFAAALLDAFPSQMKLVQMLRFRLDKNLPAISLGTNLQDIVFDLIGAAEAEGWTAKLLAAARESNPGNPELLAFAQQFGLVSSKASRQDIERIIRTTNSFLDVAQWRTQLGEMEGRVCRVEIALRGGSAHTYGTGFLVGPDVLLTTYSLMEAVINGKVKPSDVIFRFDYKRLADGTTLNPGVEFRLAAEDWLIDASPYSPADSVTAPTNDVPQPDHLDYALVRVAGEPGNQPIGQNPGQNAPKRGWIEVSAQEYDFQPHTPLLILQHPKAEPLKLAIDMDAIIGVNSNKTRVRYNTNTEGGSSGSPCFTINWELVALHHAGDPDDRFPMFNQGIPMTAILALLEQHGHRDKLGKSALIEKFYETGATTLDLSNQKLTKLPSEIWKLTELIKLNLSGNMLRELPAEIGQLAKLKNLISVETSWVVCQVVLLNFNN